MKHSAELSGTLLFSKGRAMPTSLRLPRSRPANGMMLHVASSRSEIPDPNAPVRLSMRLDRPRYRHVRLAATKLGISTQTLLQKAVEHYLHTAVPAQISEACACLKQPDMGGKSPDAPLAGETTAPASNGAPSSAVPAECG